MEPNMCENCQEEMISSNWQDGNVLYCPDCGRMIDEETGEVIDAGSKR